jgi:hypothetical protein
MDLFQEIPTIEKGDTYGGIPQLLLSPQISPAPSMLEKSVTWHLLASTDEHYLLD